MVIEINDEGVYGYGQLATILRARFCDKKSAASPRQTASCIA